MSVSELASVPCCGAVFETPGSHRFPGMHHLPEGQVGVSQGCSMHLSLQQCRKGGRVSPVSTASRLEAWRGLYPVFHEGGLLPEGHAGRGTLCTADVTGKGSACRYIVGDRAGLRAVSCVSSVLWVKDFGLG